MTKKSDELMKLLENVPVPDSPPSNEFKAMIDGILASSSPEERRIIYHRFNMRSGLKPGECALCGDAFVTDWALHRHVAGKHEIDPDSHNPFEKGKNHA